MRLSKICDMLPRIYKNAFNLKLFKAFIFSYRIATLLAYSVFVFVREKKGK